MEKTVLNRIEGLCKDAKTLLMGLGDLITGKFINSDAVRKEQFTILHTDSVSCKGAVNLLAADQYLANKATLEAINSLYIGLTAQFGGFVTATQQEINAMKASQAALQASINKILAALEFPSPAGQFVIQWTDEDGSNQQTTEGDSKLMTAIVGRIKTATIVKARDKFGNDAAVDGAPVWGSAGDAISSITVSADGMSCRIALGTVAGVSGQVTVTGDGAPGPEVAQFHSTIDFDTIADTAVEFVVSVTDEQVPPPGGQV